MVLLKKNTDIGSKVKSGYLWTLLDAGLGQPMSFAAGIVLARLLSPSDFGLMAACMIFTEVGSTLVSSGYVSGLLQKQSVSKDDLSTIFVLQLLTAGIVVLLVVSLAPLAAHFFDNKTMTSVLSILSLNVAILAFCGVPTAIANRQLNFRLLTWTSLVELIIFGIISISLALNGFGVWSLVIGKLLSRVCYTLLLYVKVGWRPCLHYNRDSAHSLIRISAQFAGKNLLDDLTKNIDYFIIGNTLGISKLGFYSRAYSLMTLPVTKLSQSLGNVLFPAFSKIQDEKERLIRGMLKSTTLISMTIFPLLTCLILVAPVLIPLVYGVKWSPTIIPLQILCLAGLIYTVDSPAVALINAKGLLTDEIKRQILHLILLVTGIIVGTRWGLAGVAWGVTGAAFIYWLLLLQLLKKRVDLSLRFYLDSLIPAVSGSVIMALCTLGSQHITQRYFPGNSIMFLINSILAAGFAYTLTLITVRHFIKKPSVTEAYVEIEGFLVKLIHPLIKILPLKLKGIWQSMYR